MRPLGLGLLLALAGCGIDGPPVPPADASPHVLAVPVVTPSATVADAGPDGL